MSGMVISGGASGTAGTSGAASGGSPAQQQLQEAQKAYTRAMRQLTQDVKDGAGKEALEADRLAVESAAAAVALAQAAVAREQQEKKGRLSAAGEAQATSRGAVREDREDLSREHADLRAEQSPSRLHAVLPTTTALDVTA